MVSETSQVNYDVKAVSPSIGGRVSVAEIVHVSHLQPFEKR